MSEPGSHDCAALLEHAGWVRALARHLTADGAGADDLAQEALVAALVRPPPEDRPLRAWLAAIVRNLARRERRSAAGRHARERVTARAEADPGTGDLLERLDSHRAVVEAVARLDEPYRAAILLRYFEGLSPDAIASRTGTPLRTVHTRLHRALSRLRADLDRSHGGDRRAWLLALVRFARGSGAKSPAAIGVLVMETKLKLVLAALAVAGVCSTVAFWPSDPDEAPPPLTAAQEALVHETAEMPSRPSAPELPSPVERRAIETLAPVAEVPTPPVPVPEKIAGRVIDSERAPVAGVLVRYFASGSEPGGEFEATTDQSGAFELDLPGGPGHLDVASPGWTSIFRPEFQGAPELQGIEPVIVVARSVTLAGVVVDVAGQPIEAATLAVPLPFGLRARFDSILDGSTTVERKTCTDEQGRFELAGAPLVPGAGLMTTHAAFLTDHRDLSGYDELALEIVLASASDGPTRVIGRVVDLDENPVEDAWVALGPSTAKSGPGGIFTLELEASAGDERLAPEDAGVVRAVKRGYLPAELARAAGEPWPDPLILRLGGAPLTIAGRVVDAAGEPVPGAEVWTDQETRFGFIDIEEGEMQMKAGANVEGILRGDPWTRRFRADSGGRFELTGLLPRDYRVHALDKQRMRATTRRIPAGVSDLEIRLEGEDFHELVAGRVTSLAGEPIEGLEVVLERSLESVEADDFEGFESLPAITDADGLFAFENVSRAVHVVEVRGLELGLTGYRRALEPGDDLANLELAVPMRVHVQIDAGQRTDAPDQAALLDENGERLYLSVHHGNSSYAMREIPLHEGRTEPFTVSETARTLVLLVQGQETLRMPLELTRGDLNTIRP